MRLFGPRDSDRKRVREFRHTFDQVSRKMADDTKLCSNCKRDISSANFVMHEIHCRRHIILCQHCNEPIPKIELEQHFNELHAKIPCEKCLKEIPKEKMSQHLAEDCIKKLVHCQYCDLSFPKDEIVPHLDYCGSRTECCPLCQQYVMLKDMMRHESSGCTYPEPKPIPRTPTDIFNMEELQQLLSSPDYGALDVFSNLQRGLQQFSSGAGRSNLLPAEPVNNGLVHAARKSDHKKTDVNVQRQRNLTFEPFDSTIKSIPPDIEYDAMLAMQLAQEDWEQDHLDIDSDMTAHPQLAVNDQSNIDMSFGGDKWKHLPHSSDIDPHPSASYIDNSTADDEEMTIPCEFCFLKISLNAYLEHMDSCPAKKAMASLDGVDLNNELSYQPGLTRTSIPVINNLRPGQRFEDFSVNHAGPDGDTMLPCEFCEEVFPSEIIIQHQGVCPASGFSTAQDSAPFASLNKDNHSNHPRPPKPVIKSKSVRQPIKSQSSHLPSASLYEYMGQDGGDTDEVPVRDRKGAKSMNVLESTANKYSPAVNRFDAAVTRPPRRHSRHSLGDEDADQSDANAAFTRLNRSALRTRAKLNKLLHVISFLQLTNFIGQDDEEVDAGSQRQAKPVRTPAQDRPDRRVVDTRLVMRKLEEQQPPRNRLLTLHTPGTRQNQLPDENNSQAAPVRNRQRSDNVFSPELRLKPDHNPLPKKR
ncbi:unnamed protein product [Lymnaea stagnalis]|uniref:TRAF-type domain-containing protein n=1 Tax=Lymnaea stagnalis TaxID=6523 RepID=A0AAV2H3Z7_LYMST